MEDVTPDNLAVIAGNQALLRCSSSHDNVQWSEHISVGRGETIFVQANKTYCRSGCMDPDRGNRYSLDNPETGVYNLQIGPVQMADGGMYSCLNFGSTTYVQLIVLGTKPTMQTMKKKKKRIET